MAVKKNTGASRRKSAKAEGAKAGASVGQTTTRVAGSPSGGVAQTAQGTPQQSSSGARQANAKGRRSAPAPSERHLHAGEADQDAYIAETVTYEDGRKFVAHERGSRHASAEVDRLRSETSAEERNYLLDRGALRGSW